MRSTLRGLHAARSAALALVEVLHEAVHVERFFVAADVLTFLVLEFV
jgi:hypothetical protein